MPYLTSIQWWWSQVSWTQSETVFPVTMPWRSGRPPQLLEMKNTIRPPGTNIYPYSDLPWRGISLETLGKAPESHLNMGYFHWFTIDIKMSLSRRLRTVCPCPMLHCTPLPVKVALFTRMGGINLSASTLQDFGDQFEFDRGGAL